MLIVAGLILRWAKLEEKGFFQKYWRAVSVWKIPGGVVGRAPWVQSMKWTIAITQPTVQNLEMILLMVSLRQIIIYLCTKPY